MQDKTRLTFYEDLPDSIEPSELLKHFEDLLASVPRFLRAHKSYIINIEEVVEYSKSAGGLIYMSNSLTAGISPDKLDEFLRLMQVN